MQNPIDIRLQAIYDIGVKVDDSLELARLETAKREGAYEAYSNISSSFSDLFEQIDGQHTSIEADIARAWMTKMIDVCKHMIEYSSMQVYAARGAENQTKMLVEMIKKSYDLESEKKCKKFDENLHELQDLGQNIIAPVTAPPAVVDAPAAQNTVQIRSRTIKEQRQKSQTTR